ncbi:MULTISPECIES: efflux RND transporter periplasmic adaptor subunit [unclassified Leptolyngbya]|uniref:efflux RND transporter periplasmic adaptor subunit n=1 Tax=unclassified Leptolyngbya TaxID=2650499 RepID=UPI00168756EE|nr:MULTISPECIES: efflux RND transporter periplasmic adaptor subunit [unclassified Leptolyngbya]MBD1910922.1 efflux RND transporter periplasmic adaptor subunit [Leptolyngbya sp. FACHB-8]MBD2154967.1 efflux RND transporter periplasmic adaptor subunit [Leptolyngbya sp. FACHB-16]
MAIPRPLTVLMVLAMVPSAVSCSLPVGSQPQTQAQSRPGGGPSQDGPTSVETAIAQTGSLESAKEFTGTTQPARLVALRAQTEGQLLNLAVDVGDTVSQGQALGQLDDRLLVASLRQAEAELASRRSAVAQAQAEVSNSQAQAAQASVQLQQAIADAERFQQLATDGAVTTQQAEQAQTERLAAEQALRSAEEQVRTRQQAVRAAQAQVVAQEATVAEVGQRRAYSTLKAPINGAVLERLRQPGDLVRPGEEVVQLGDFSGVKVVVPVSELELSRVTVGQSVQVRLDAFPDRPFSGQVARIAPAADAAARLVPVEIYVPNGDRRITGGLLARVTFQSGPQTRVVVSEQALELGEAPEPTVFVLDQSGESPKVVARTVQVGDRANGNVEILSGLKPGETLVTRSSGPLSDGQSVKLSLLSETSSPAPQ